MNRKNRIRIDSFAGCNDSRIHFSVFQFIRPSSGSWCAIISSRCSLSALEDSEGSGRPRRLW